MKNLWIAYRIIHYEGDDVLGVFTTKAKAIEECQLYDNQHWSAEEHQALEFRQHQTSENHPIVFLAYGIYQYSVREIEINTPLMRKIEKSGKPVVEPDLEQRVKALEAEMDRLRGDGK